MTEPGLWDSSATSDAAHDGVAAPLARILCATDRFGLAARLEERFAPADAAALFAARDVQIAAVDFAEPGRAQDFVAALRAAGAVAACAGTLVGTVASGPALQRAQESDPRWAPECSALRMALRNFSAPPTQFRMRDRQLDVRDEAHVMGILNVTPDSFYERVGDDATEALQRAQALVADGAALLDIGGQSYAHWNPKVSLEEELRRVCPAVTAIQAAQLDVALSIDTSKAAVAAGALAAGAHLINDCSGLSDPVLAQTVAQYDAALVVMHLKGELNVRSAGSYVYRDALAEIVEFLFQRTEQARAAGVAADSIAIDPGLEFGKEPATDLEILDRFGELRALGYPIVLASSRKSFLGRLFDRPAAELLIPSLATAGLGIAAGARVLRVHDVAPTVALARMYAAITPRRRAGATFAPRMPGTPDVAGNHLPRHAV